jgi:hypothetical protein
VFNLGLSGRRASEWRQALEYYYVPRDVQSVVWLGVNDITYVGASAKTIGDDLSFIVEHLLSLGHRVLLLDQIASDRRAGPIHQQITATSRAIDAGFETNPTRATVVRITDLFQPVEATGIIPLLTDGIHITEAGNAAVWERIAAGLNQNPMGRAR